jgi:hypothetical protein
MKVGEMIITFCAKGFFVCAIPTLIFGLLLLLSISIVTVFSL